MSLEVRFQLLLLALGWRRLKLLIHPLEDFDALRNLLERPIDLGWSAPHNALCSFRADIVLGFRVRTRQFKYYSEIPWSLFFTP